MIRTAALAALALLAAACAPQGGLAVDPDAPVQSADAAACAAQGGTMRQVGRMQSWQCITTYADAGKACTDGAQCQGDCRVEGNTGLAAGAPATGVCQADSSRFGCYATVEGGRTRGTICVD